MSKTFPSGFMLASILLISMPKSAQAATIWTDWTRANTGTPGSAAGSVGGVGVSYSGELIGFVIDGSSNIWSPDSSFTGGTVTASPSTVGDDLRLNGFSTEVNTISFVSAVQNPIFAIWSLGQPSLLASFTFNATPTLQAGGPNSAFGGASVSVAGNTVSGLEGNGVVQFTGTFNSISWTNTPENYYAFTVGVNGPANVVPEPSSFALIGLSLAGLMFRLRKRLPNINF